MFSTNLNLTRRATIAVVAALWNQETVCYYFKKHFLAVNDVPLWQEVENYVLSCIDKLELPDSLKLNLRDFIPLVGWKVIHWFSVTKSSFQTASTNNDLPLNFYFVWTAEGNLDFIETAKATINCNLSNKILCYSLASVFCIEEILFTPEACMYLEEANSFCTYSPREGTCFHQFWLDTLNANWEFETNVTRYEEGCQLASTIKCVPVMKYFLNKLPTENKNNAIRMSIRKELIFPQDGNMLYFLFTQLEASQRNKIIKEHIYSTLLCLIEWPFQEYFMAVAITAWDYMSKSEFQGLFYEIAGRVSDFYPSNIYTNLIKEFWHCSPAEFRADFIHECVSGKVFGKLFLQRYISAVIQMLFDECTAKERLQIIFRPESMDICEVLVMRLWWDYLKLFVCSCIPSKEVMEIFSTQFQNTLRGVHEGGKECTIAAFLEKTSDWY